MEKLEQIIYEKLYLQIPCLNQFLNIPIDLEKYLNQFLEASQKKQFIEEISQSINKKRPEFRKSKQLEFDCKMSIETNLADCSAIEKIQEQNISFKQCIVEIKPKSSLEDKFSQEDLEKIIESQQLTLTSEKLQKLLKEDNSIMSLKFGKVQIQKLQKSQISQISEYDPRQLFSNSFELINKALESLIKTPQNNLRVNQLSQEMDWKKSVVSILMENSQLMNIIQKFQNLFRVNINKMRDVMQEMEILLSEQKDLSKIIEENCLQIKNEILGYSEDSVIEKEFDNAINSNSVEIKIQSVLKLIMRFLISYTWKDLSMIFQINILQQISPELQNKLIENNFSLSKEFPDMVYKIGLVDLELKRLNKIDEIILNENDLLKAYIKFKNFYK